MANNEKLLSFEFICLTLISFFAFCNMAVFYSFFSYLARIGIPLEWRGALLGLEPMTAFVLRLAVIPLLHVGNATAVLFLGLGMMVAALFSYEWAVTIPTLIALRIFHGTAFVLLVSASMALVAHFIPREKSGQGFGLVSVSVLIPYAVMPLVMEALLPHVGNEADIYRGITILALPAFGLLAALRKRMSSVLQLVDGALLVRPTLAEIRKNLQEPNILLILMVHFCVYLGYATVFFFVKAHSQSVGISDVGSFFTISTLVMIGLRLWGGLFFDKIDKVTTSAFFTLLLIPWFFLFGRMRGDGMFHLWAGYYGLCIGFIMPLLSAALFEASPTRMRGLNTNLALFMMDAAFFLSPYAGGLLLALGYSSADLFNACAGFLLLSFLCLLALTRQRAGAAIQPSTGPHTHTHTHK